MSDESKSSQIDFEYEESCPFGDAWMMTFADLLSLLLVFFILIYAMSSMRTGEWEKVVDALGDSFKSDKMIEEGAYSTYLGVSKVDIRTGMDLDYLNVILENKVNEDVFLAKKVAINNSGDSLVVTLKSTNLFEGNTPVLTEDSRLLLFVLGESLLRVNNKIEVVGYLKKQGKKAKMDNWELALARAVEVAGELREYGNLSKLEAVVDIKEMKSSEENKANNVDIVIRRYTKEY